MVNRGIAPPDPTTDVGKFRFAAGDSSFVALAPPEVGFGDYSVWSDDEIEVFLVVGGGNLARAIAIAYRQLAATWASTGAAIKTDDLSYSAKESVGNWIALADYWDKLADEQGAAAVDDYFDLVTVGGNECYRPPEASPWRVDRWPSRGCW